MESWEKKGDRPTFLDLKLFTSRVFRSAGAPSALSHIYHYVCTTSQLVLEDLGLVILPIINI